MLDSPECVWPGRLYLGFVAIETDPLLDLPGHRNGSHHVC